MKLSEKNVLLLSDSFEMTKVNLKVLELKYNNLIVFPYNSVVINDKSLMSSKIPIISKIYSKMFFRFVRYDYLKECLYNHTINNFNVDKDELQIIKSTRIPLLLIGNIKLLNKFIALQDNDMRIIIVDKAVILFDDFLEEYQKKNKQNKTVKDVNKIMVNNYKANAEDFRSM